jgi:hypothetical protein
VDEQMTSEDDIRPLFRDRDVSSMSFAFDLSSYDDARANAEPISTSGSPPEQCPAMAIGRQKMLSAPAPGSTMAFRPRRGERHGGRRAAMSEHEPYEHEDSQESALLRAQEHKGYGDDEGEREELLEDPEDDEPKESA